MLIPEPRRLPGKSFNSGYMTNVKCLILLFVRWDLRSAQDIVARCLGRAGNNKHAFQLLNKLDHYKGYHNKYISGMSMMSRM